MTDRIIVLENFNGAAGTTPESRSPDSSAVGLQWTPNDGSFNGLTIDGSGKAYPPADTGTYSETSWVSTLGSSNGTQSSIGWSFPITMTTQFSLGGVVISGPNSYYPDVYVYVGSAVSTKEWLCTITIHRDATDSYTYLSVYADHDRGQIYNLGANVDPDHVVQLSTSVEPFSGTLQVVVTETSLTVNLDGSAIYQLSNDFSAWTGIPIDFFGVGFDIIVADNQADSWVDSFELTAPDGAGGGGGSPLYWEIRWPDTYTVRPIKQVLSNDGDGDPRDFRRRSTRPSATATVGWQMQGPELTKFMDFWQTLLVRGSKWFQLYLPSAGGILTHDVRFTSPIKVVEAGFDLFNVTSTIEIDRRKFSDDGTGPGYIQYGGSLAKRVQTPYTSVELWFKNSAGTSFVQPPSVNTSLYYGDMTTWLDGIRLYPMVVTRELTDDGYGTILAYAPYSGPDLDLLTSWTVFNGAGMSSPSFGQNIAEGYIQIFFTSIPTAGEGHLQVTVAESMAITQITFALTRAGESLTLSKLGAYSQAQIFGQNVNYSPYS